MDIIETDLWLCADCVQPVVNGDYSGLDYYYSGVECDERMEAINAGMARLSGLVIVDGYDEFSTRACDCCESHLHGERHEFVRLGNAERHFLTDKAPAHREIWSSAFCE